MIFASGKSKANAIAPQYFAGEPSNLQNKQGFSEQAKKAFTSSRPPLLRLGTSSSSISSTGSIFKNLHPQDPRCVIKSKRKIKITSEAQYDQLKAEVISILSILKEIPAEERTKSIAKVEKYLTEIVVATAKSENKENRNKFWGKVENLRLDFLGGRIGYVEELAKVPEEFRHGVSFAMIRGDLGKTALVDNRLLTPAHGSGTR